jgi:CheY-like chemotaxis protein
MSEKICFLVDDDEDDCEIFQLALQHFENVKCVVCNNAKEAIEKLKDDTFQPDFIFLDLNMPLMTGAECLVEIRKMKKLKDTPVWMYSTSSQHGDKISLEKLGATGFITKPTHLSMLIKILKEFLCLK